MVVRPARVALAGPRITMHSLAIYSTVSGANVSESAKRHSAHCATVAAQLERYPAVLSWLERMRLIGRRHVGKIKIPQAVHIARATPAAALPPGEGGEVDGCAVGELVTRTLVLQ